MAWINLMKDFLICKLIIFFNLLFFLPFTTNAQKADSVNVKLQWHQKKYIKVAAIPVSLSIVGLSTIAVKSHTWISKYNIQAEYLEKQYSSTLNIEDHLRYVPIPFVYGLNLLGIKGENSFVERSIILAKALLIQHIIVTYMKKSFNVERPKGGNHSFPSSHTARAFTTATFMHHEFKHVSLWYSVAGYSFAATTGFLRMRNNHHWFPDVLVGAGIGILSSNLAYFTHKHMFSKWLQNKKKGKLVISFLPVYQKTMKGMYLIIKL